MLKILLAIFFFLIYLITPGKSLAVVPDSCSVNPNIMTPTQTAEYRVVTTRGGVTENFYLNLARISPSYQDLSENPPNIVTLSPNQTFTTTIGPFSIPGRYSIHLARETDINSIICDLSFDVTDNQPPPESDLSLSITLDPPSPTQYQIPKINYSNMTAGNCLVVYFHSTTGYIKPTNPSINPLCYTDQNVYASFITSGDHGEVFLEVEPPGNYDINVKNYEEDCNLAGLNCSWKFIEISNKLKYEIIASQGIYTIDLKLNPQSGMIGDTFMANVSLKKTADQSPVSNQLVDIKTITSPQTLLGSVTTDASGNSSINISNQVNGLSPGTHTVRAITELNNEVFYNDEDFNLTLPAGQTCTQAKIDECKLRTDGKTSCINDTCTTLATAGASGEPCPDGSNKLKTALGCVSTDPQQLILALLRLVSYASGGIALLLMAIGAIQMIASAGSPEALKEGQQRFTSAVIGLLFILFSVLLLQIIGVDLLDLPGFS